MSKLTIVDLHQEEGQASELTATERSRVSGGMKWDPNYESPNVIDARGGYLDVGPWYVTFDINGNPSSAGERGPGVIG